MRLFHTLAPQLLFFSGEQYLPGLWYLYQGPHPLAPSLLFCGLACLFSGFNAVTGAPCRSLLLNPSPFSQAKSLPWDEVCRGMVSSS